MARKTLGSKRLRPGTFIPARIKPIIKRLPLGTFAKVTRAQDLDSKVRMGSVVTITGYTMAGELRVKTKSGTREVVAANSLKPLKLLENEMGKPRTVKTPKKAGTVRKPKRPTRQPVARRRSPHDQTSDNIRQLTGVAIALPIASTLPILAAKL